MNHYLKKTVLLFSCTLVFLTVHAQSSNLSPIEDMVYALKNDRVTEMAKYFDTYVPITINNAQQLYSHNQAQEVLKDFFEKNTPKGFTVIDNGSPDNTSKFVIGYFTTQAGVTYNVYILMKLKTTFMVQDFRMNAE